MNAGQKFFMVIGAITFGLLLVAGMLLGSAWAYENFGRPAMANAAPGTYVTPTNIITDGVTSLELPDGRIVVVVNNTNTNVATATGGSSQGGNVTINGNVPALPATSTDNNGLPLVASVLTSSTRLAVCNHLAIPCLEGQPTASGNLTAAFDGRGLVISVLGETRMAADDVLMVERVGNFRFNDPVTNTFVATSGVYTIHVSNDRGAQSWLLIDGTFEVVGPASSSGVTANAAGPEVKVIFGGAEFALPADKSDDFWFGTAQADGRPSEIDDCWTDPGCNFEVVGGPIVVGADLSFAVDGYGTAGLDKATWIVLQPGQYHGKLTHPTNEGWLRFTLQ